MKKVLVIESSPRGDLSATRKLTQAITKEIQAKYKDAVVTVRDLTTHPLPHLDPARLNAFFAQPHDHTENDKRAIKDSDEVVAEILNTDIIVLAAPMWNFSIPSVLKSWIDHLARAGKTFKYSASGPEGLIKGKKLYIAIASGAVYSEGPYKSFDFVEPYLRSVLHFLGITDVTTIRAEGLSVPGVQDTAIAKAVNSIKID